MLNSKKNLQIFYATLDKTCINLIEFEEDVTKSEKDKNIILYDVTQNMEKLCRNTKNQLFQVIYNVQLLKFLKSSYIEKINRKRYEKKKYVVGDYSFDFDKYEDLPSDEESLHGVNLINPDYEIKENHKLKNVLEFKQTHESIKKKKMYFIYEIALKRHNEGYYDEYFKQKVAERTLTKRLTMKKPSTSYNFAEKLEMNAKKGTVSLTESKFVI